jgi:hypothetical protein
LRYVRGLEKWRAVIDFVLAFVDGFSVLARILLEDVTNFAFAIAEEARPLLGWRVFVRHCGGFELVVSGQGRWKLCNEAMKARRGRKPRLSAQLHIRIGSVLMRTTIAK